MSRRGELKGYVSAHKGTLEVALTAASVLEAHVMLNAFLLPFHQWDDQKTTSLCEVMYIFRVPITKVSRADTRFSTYLILSQTETLQPHLSEFRLFWNTIVI